jgi:hypothetical protein
MRVAQVVGDGVPATVVDVRPYPQKEDGTIMGHVLCVRDHPFHPYVIWTYHELHGRADVMSGTYLSSFEDALRAWEDVV